MRSKTRMRVVRYDEDGLTRFVAQVFTSAGVRDGDADIVAASLVGADAQGVRTHGTARIAAYVGQLERGEVEARPVDRVVARTPGSALLDGGGGLGAPVGARAIDMAMALAEGSGIGMVGVRNVAHFGAAGFYARRAARRGFLAVVMSSTSAVVAPFGGAEARIGNSPLAIAGPGDGREAAFMLDIAQSVTARGRVKLALDAGEPIPKGWAVDSHGQSTTDPDLALRGALLASGGHKGSGLSIAIEVMAAGLTGGQLSQDVHHSGFTVSDASESLTGRDVTVGCLFLAIPADVFGDGAGVRRRTERILRHVRQCPPAAGVARVLAPGDIEAARAQESQEQGVPVMGSTDDDLSALAQRYGLTLPTPLNGRG